jgi:hypothetical protein
MVWTTEVAPVILFPRGISMLPFSRIVPLGLAIALTTLPLSIVALPGFAQPAPFTFIRENQMQNTTTETTLSIGQLPPVFSLQIGLLSDWCKQHGWSDFHLNDDYQFVASPPGSSAIAPIILFPSRNVKQCLATNP